MKEITLNIDRRTVTVASGTTILEAARAAGVYIPTICSHPAVDPVAKIPELKVCVY